MRKGFGSLISLSTMLGLETELRLNLKASGFTCYSTKAIMILSMKTIFQVCGRVPPTFSMSHSTLLSFVFVYLNHYIKNGMT